MALETNELYATKAQKDFPRLVPGPDGVLPKLFKAVSGGKLLPNGTPVAKATAGNVWEAYDQGGSGTGTNVVMGILFEREGLQVNDSGVSNTEKMGNVLLFGTIHRDDVNTAAIRAVLSGSPSEANLDAALAALRDKGIMVQGLPTYPTN